MVNPAPTPYDITAIPVIPWEPGLITWLIVLAIGLMALLLARPEFTNRFRSKPSLLKLLKRELKSRQGLSPSYDDIVRLAKLVRRILLMEDPRMSSLTARELLHLSSTKNDPDLKVLANALCTVEDLLYQDTNSEINADSYEALLGATKNYCMRYETKS